MGNRKFVLAVKTWGSDEAIHSWKYLKAHILQVGSQALAVLRQAVTAIYAATVVGIVQSWLCPHTWCFRKALFLTHSVS